MTEPNIDYLETAKIVGWTLASVITALWGRSKVKRMWSQDRVETASDDDEIDLLARIQAERREWREREAELINRADRAFKERNDAVEKLGSLSREVEILTNHVEKLENRIAAMQLRIEELITNRRVEDG